MRAVELLLNNELDKGCPGKNVVWIGGGGVVNRIEWCLRKNQIENCHENELKLGSDKVEIGR